jgi:hypothetical protein
MKFYEAASGHWLPEGVSMAEHEAAMAGNYDGGADLAAFDERFGDEWLRRERIMAKRRLDADGIWVARDGRHVAHAEMEDVHLANIVAMLERHNIEVALAYPGLWAEAVRREVHRAGVTPHHGDPSDPSEEDI